MMNKVITLVLFGFFVVFYTPALAYDRLFMENGDRLTGNILAHRDHIISLQTDYGVSDIPMSKISGIKSSSPEKELFYKKALSNAKAQPQVAAIPAAPVVNTSVIRQSPAPLKTVEADKKFLNADWSGNVNAGTQIRTGNSDTQQLNIDAKLKAEWEKHTGEVVLDYNNEQEDDNETVDDRALNFTHNYFFNDKWFMNNFLGFEQDDINDLDLRTTVSTGLGYQPFNQDDLTLKFSAGPGYQREKLANGNTENSLIAKWTTDYEQKFYDDLFRLFHNHSLSVPADDTNAYLFKSRTGLRVPLRQGIIASGEVKYDRDNAPAPDAGKEDTTYSLKLGYEW